MQVQPAGKKSAVSKIRNGPRETRPPRSVTNDGGHNRPHGRASFSLLMLLSRRPRCRRPVRHSRSPGHVVRNRASDSLSIKSTFLDASSTDLKDARPRDDERRRPSPSRESVGIGSSTRRWLDPYPGPWFFHKADRISVGPEGTTFCPSPAFESQCKGLAKHSFPPLPLQIGCVDWV